MNLEGLFFVPSVFELRRSRQCKNSKIGWTIRVVAPVSNCIDGVRTSLANGPYIPDCVAK